MNRQAGPSIVLSVLIVSFFAVALFQRDPPRPAGRRARAGAGRTIARAAPTQGRGTSRSSGGQAGLAEVVKPASARREVHSRVDAGVPDSSIISYKPASAHSSRPPGAAKIVAEASKRAQQFDVPRQPGSAFTVVEANETIQDVAVRVYGSGDLAESLWRANRDALPRRDSPLATGMALRTPNLR